MKKNEIIYINKSTNLPIDFEIKEKLNTILNPLLVTKETNQLNQINIFFVDELELNNTIKSKEYKTDEIENIFNPDLLGIFIDKSSEVNGQSLIKISPEKILKCAYEFKKKEKLKESNFEIYKILLVKVILHKLGHYFLSKDSYQDFSTAQWICDGLDTQEDDEYYLNNVCNSHNNYPSNDWYHSFPWYKIIEESLANRYVLEHNWLKNEKEIIWKFIASQPVEYKAAISWKNTNNIDDIFQSWKNIKDNNRLEEYLNEYDKTHTIFKELTEKLIDNKNIKDCDFNEISINHMEQVVNSSNIVSNSHIFNGTFGILWELSNYYEESNPKKALDYSEKTHGYHQEARTKFLQEELDK